MSAKRTVNVPIVPKISPLLDEWSGEHERVIEARGVQAQDQDFSLAKRLSLDDVMLERCLITGAKLEALEMIDSRLQRLEGAGLQSSRTSLLRTELIDCRMTGADFPEAIFEDCTFRNCKFDDVGFRFAAFKRVQFDNCVLLRADFSHAELSHVTFTDCDLDEANFASATCKSVNLTDENLVNCRGVLGLKGAHISNEQLIQIAPLLAAELGFQISD